MDQNDLRGRGKVCTRCGRVQRGEYAFATCRNVAACARRVARRKSFSAIFQGPTQGAPAAGHGGRREGAGRKPSEHGRAGAALNLRVQDELRARLDTYAAAKGLTRSAAALALLRAELARAESRAGGAR